MKRSFLSSALALAVLAGALAGCGGSKDTYPVNVNIIHDTEKGYGLAIPPLTLKETVSGQVLTITDPAQTVASFPNTLEYGTEYNVTASAPHQDCLVPNGHDSAGHLESIQVNVFCLIAKHDISVGITVPTGNGGVITGLKLINGSDVAAAITAAADTTVAQFPNIAYNTSYSLAILAQPTDNVTKCKFSTPSPAPAGLGQVTDLTISGTVLDASLSFAIVCAK